MNPSDGRTRALLHLETEVARIEIHGSVHVGHEYLIALMSANHSLSEFSET